MSSDRDISTDLSDLVEDYVENDIDKFITSNKKDINIHHVIDNLKKCDIYDLSRIISYLINIVTSYNNNDKISNDEEIIHNNKEYLNVKKCYEFNLVKIKTIEYLNSCIYTKRYIPTEFSNYLKFDCIINEYINFIFDYYYNKQNIDSYYDKINTYFNSLFSILELKIDLLNYNDIKNKIKVEYDLLTNKILNLLTNINIIVNNKF